MVPAPNEEVQKIATDSEIVADGITRVPDTRFQKSSGKNERRRLPSSSIGAAWQWNNGEERRRSRASATSGTHSRRGHESAQEMGRTSVDQTNAKHTDIHNGTRHGALARLFNTRHMWEDTERLQHMPRGIKE